MGILLNVLAYYLGFHEEGLYFFHMPFEVLVFQIPFHDDMFQVFPCEFLHLFHNYNWFQHLQPSRLCLRREGTTKDQLLFRIGIWEGNNSNPW